MHSPGSTPVFIETARDLKARLSAQAGDQAGALAREAAACLETFEAWVAQPPTPEQRSEAVRRLLDLQRAVTELFGTLRP